MTRTLRSCTALLAALLGTATTQAQWEVVGTQQFSSGWARHTVIDFAPDNTPYVAYGDVGLQEKAVVRRFFNGAWQVVGTEGFSAGTALDISLDISADGVPYVAYRDMANGQKATVMAYQGGSWQTVGQAGLSEGQAMKTCLAIAPDGTPYISYLDGAHENKVTTRRFANGSWTTLGAEGFSPYFASSVSMTFDGNGVVYTGYAGTSGCRVERFVNGAWELLGVESSFYNARTASLAIGSDHTVYMAYLDGSNDMGGSMKKYVNGTWEQVGQVAFTNEDASMDYYTMAMDDNDVPYVAYKDSHAGQKATVQRFVNDAWELVGPMSFTPNWSDFVSLAIDQDNVPYVVFSDATDFTFKSTAMRFAEGSAAVDEPHPGDAFTFRADADRMCVKLINAPVGALVSLMDMAGKVVGEHRVADPGAAISTAHLKAGLYLLRLDHQGRTRSGKVAVVR